MRAADHPQPIERASHEEHKLFPHGVPIIYGLRG